MGQRRVRQWAEQDLRGQYRRLADQVEQADRAHVGGTEWLRLRFEVLRAFVEGQRIFVGVQSSIIADLRANAAVREPRCRRSREVFEALGALHALARRVDRKLHGR